MRGPAHPRARGGSWRRRKLDVLRKDALYCFAVRYKKKEAAVATDRDLIYSGKRDELLIEMSKTLMNLDDTMPIDVVAGLLFLDQKAGIHADNDYILMCPGYAVWFLQMVEIVDQKVRSLLLNQDDPAPDETVLTVEPFAVSFSMEGAEYPDIIRGKTMHVRVMTEEEAVEYPFGCCTVRSDGHIIHLPNPA